MWSNPWDHRASTHCFEGGASEGVRVEVRAVDAAIAADQTAACYGAAATTAMAVAVVEATSDSADSRKGWAGSGRPLDPCSCLASGVAGVEADALDASASEP